MSVKWWTVFAVAAITACNESSGPNIGADGFWTGTVPQGSIELRLIEESLSLDGFGIIQAATTRDIAASGSRDREIVSLSITEGPTRVPLATFSGEVTADSLIGTWTSQVGGAATVRLAR